MKSTSKKVARKALAKNLVNRKQAKKPCVLQYWRSFADSQWYCHIKRRRGGKITLDSQSYSRKATLIKCKKNDPSLNWQNIDMEEIQDPNHKP